MRRAEFAPAWFVVPAIALVVVLPLALRGCSCGHDFDFHLVSWIEAAAQFRAGTMHPHWAFSPAWNAGEPRFVFYPPLSWTLGGLLGMVLPWPIVPVVYTWMALTAAGGGMYWLARQMAGQSVGNGAAWVAAAIYVASPYMIFTAYERTAYAELLAAAWIPLLLAGVLREKVTMLGIAIPVALLWLTNAPAAVMGCYALALLAAVRLLLEWKTPRESHTFNWKAGVRVAGGTALGISLAAFYVLPAAYERRWVQIAMATIAGMRIGDNFLFHHSGDPAHDAVLHTASMVAVILLAAAGAVFVAALATRREQRKTLVPLAVLAAAIAFMMTPISAAVWQLAPEMSFLQFPWRLLAVLAAVVCAGIAVPIDRLKLPVPMAAAVAFVLVAAMAWPAAWSFRQGCDDEDTVAAQLAAFQTKAGVNATDEYTPTEADNDSLAHGVPAFWLAADGDAPAPATNTVGPVPLHFTVIAPRDEALVLNLRLYPAWQVRINGVPGAERIPRTDGLIAMPVRAGVVKVDVAYVEGWDERAGEGISAAALACCVGMAALGRLHRVR